MTFSRVKAVDRSGGQLGHISSQRGFQPFCRRQLWAYWSRGMVRAGIRTNH